MAEAEKAERGRAVVGRAPEAAARVSVGGASVEEVAAETVGALREVVMWVAAAMGARAREVVARA